MDQGKSRRPKGKFVQTRQSMQAAETVASWTGHAFDPEAVSAIADDYYENMFASVLGSLDLSPDSIEFISGSYRMTTTYAAMGETGHQIVFDETFDFWTFGLTFYGCVAAFFVLSEEEWDQFMADLGDMLLLYSSADLQESVRDGFWFYIQKYKKCLEFSHALSKAMLGFILCHEIAHCQLGHLDRPADMAMEFEADLLASQHFIKLIEASGNDKDSAFYIHPAQQAAPLMSMELLSLHEAWLSLKGARVSDNKLHPVALDRKTNIEAEILPFLNEDSAHFYQGFMKGVGDIKEKMEKNSLNSI